MGFLWFCKRVLSYTSLNIYWWGKHCRNNKMIRLAKISYANVTLKHKQLDIESSIPHHYYKFSLIVIQTRYKREFYLWNLIQWQLRSNWCTARTIPKSVPIISTLCKAALLYQRKNKLEMAFWCLIVIHNINKGSSNCKLLKLRFDLH